MFSERFDNYLRREDSYLAESLQRLCPLVGEEYLHSDWKVMLDYAVAVPTLAVAVPGIIVCGAINAPAGVSDIFFSQQRIVPNDDCDPNFTEAVWKVRSMVPDADKHWRVVTEANYSEQSDPRITPWGRIMRRTKLDELPQVLQVLRGQLSVVGIRPMTQDANNFLLEKWGSERYSQWAEAYHGQRLAGLTGLNQALNPRSKEDIYRDRYDKLYAQKASLGLDMYILWKTLGRLGHTRPSASEAQR